MGQIDNDLREALEAGITEAEAEIKPRWKEAPPDVQAMFFRKEGLTRAELDEILVAMNTKNLGFSPACHTVGIVAAYIGDGLLVVLCAKCGSIGATIKVAEK